MSDQLEHAPGMTGGGEVLPGFDLLQAMREFNRDQRDLSNGNNRNLERASRHQGVENPFMALFGITKPVESSGHIEFYPDGTATIIGYDQNGARIFAPPNLNSPRPLKTEEIGAQNYNFDSPGGHAAMRRSDDGTLTFYSGGRRIESRDGGRTWTNPENRAEFRGSITLENGNLVIQNDAGVRIEHRPDGTQTRSMRTTSGETVTVRNSGRTTTVTDNSGTWTSTDGRNYTNEETGETWEGTLGIEDNGTYWSRAAEGERREIGRTPQADEAVRRQREAEERNLARQREEQERQRDIQRQTDARQREIEERYHVRITPAGQNYRENDRAGEFSITSRQPTLAELDVLERSLSRGRTRDNDNLEITFYADDAGSRRRTYQGRYQPDQSRVEIFSSNISGNGWYGLEGTIEHELAHHAQWEAGRVGGRAQGSINNLYDRMGWDGERLRDRDGNLWSPGENGSWTATINGERQTLTNDQMRERARVRPGSTYFTNPREMQAEAASRFRLDREGLMNENPALYAMIQEWDQEQIDARHGADSTGRSNMIRDIDGRLIVNTRENERRIRDLEVAWRANVPRRSAA